MTSNPSTPDTDTDGPKTETHLTTRIRINIPGSRPIPPVVVRKPVKDGAQDASPAAAGPAPDAAPRTPERRPAQARPAGSAPALPAAAAPAPAPAAPAPEPAPAPAGPPAGGWFAPRKAVTPPPTATPPAGVPVGGPGGPGAAGPGGHGGPGAPGPGGPGGHGGPGAPGPGASYGSGVPGAGTGAGFAPPAEPGRPQPPAAHGTGAGFAPAPAVGGPGVGAPQGYAGYDNGPVTEPFPAFPEPAGPTGGPALGTVPVGAEAPPSWPGPEAFDTPAPAPVPAPGPAAPPPGPKPPRQMTPPPAPAGKSGKAAPAGKPAKKKGRSKLVLLGGGIVVLAGVAYGAGLLMNHSDVPKGTTVLGVDISGSRDDAVAKLQTAFGKRAAAPLQLSVGGKQVELKPEKAGLTLDSQTTVRNATGSDYNPVTVIGSLFGVERTATAVMPVDEEKLRVSLQELAGTAGSASESTIKFDTGKAVAVPGKAGEGLDVDASVDKVTKAFRALVADGKAPTVQLPVAKKEPTVTQAELDRAMKEFAEPAMSGVATVKAGTKSIPFGPKSLPKILSMTAVDGRLVEKYDLEALKATYGNAFDGVLITRGTGAKTPVTPQDVAGALGKALIGKTPAERTVTIDTNAN
ncbi:hypothetical protein [Streptomyces sp. C]|uniref:hypothetical protein n=1 Tax=Streptomyces sp. C TaxID=253839 RepID=UPI0001B55D48|nr:predicted protein [Streptomyces sp. C]